MRDIFEQVSHNFHQVREKNQCDLQLRHAGILTRYTVGPTYKIICAVLANIDRTRSYELFPVVVPCSVAFNAMLDTLTRCSVLWLLDKCLIRIHLSEFTRVRRRRQALCMCSNVAVTPVFPTNTQINYSLPNRRVLEATMIFIYIISGRNNDAYWLRRPTLHHILDFEHRRDDVM